MQKKKNRRLITIQLKSESLEEGEVSGYRYLNLLMLIYSLYDTKTLFIENYSLSHENWLWPYYNF